MKCVCPRPGVSSDSQFGVRGRLTVYRGPGFLAAVRVLSTCHEDEEPKQPSGATPANATAITSGNESGIFSFEDEIIVLLVCPFPAELCH